jgi:ABC-2 type transport system ATP-binding protein
MADIDASVVEVEAADMPAVRRALEPMASMRSLAQLGARLHVLLRRDLEHPDEQVRAVLRSAGLEAQVERVPATLEDVFVAATGFREREGHAAAGSAA